MWCGCKQSVYLSQASCLNHREAQTHSTFTGPLYPYQSSTLSQTLLSQGCWSFHGHICNK
jgi:hypothetical protein